MHDRDWAKSAQADLRGILNEWDPLGVSAVVPHGDADWPDDEYDCLRDPILSGLLNGADRSVIAKLLGDELEGHFSLPSRLVTATILDRIFEWWGSVK